MTLVIECVHSTRVQVHRTPHTYKFRIGHYIFEVVTCAKLLPFFLFFFSFLTFFRNRSKCFVGNDVDYLVFIPIWVFLCFKRHINDLIKIVVSISIWNDAWTKWYFFQWKRAFILNFNKFHPKWSVNKKRVSSLIFHECYRWHSRKMLKFISTLCMVCDLSETFPAQLHFRFNQLRKRKRKKTLKMVSIIWEKE